jgi:hypothetical protein
LSYDYIEQPIRSLARSVKPDQTPLDDKQAKGTVS